MAQVKKINFNLDDKKSSWRDKLFKNPENEEVIKAEKGASDIASDFKKKLNSDLQNTLQENIEAQVKSELEDPIPRIIAESSEEPSIDISILDDSLNQNDDANTKIEILDKINLINAFSKIPKVESVYNDRAQSLLRAQVPQIREISTRFQNPINSQYDKNTAELYQRIGMNTGSTSDAKLQAAIFSDANKMALEYKDKQNRALSENWINYLDNLQKNKQLYAQAEQERLSKNAQIKNAAENIKSDGELFGIAKRRELWDKALYRWQSMLNQRGATESSISNKLYQLGLLRSEYLSKGLNTSGIDNLIKEVKSKNYHDYVVRNARYGTPIAAKGGKLRSTSDQMLLDNEKEVAKAIEKMNDNTMKLILKALS